MEAKPAYIAVSIRPDIAQAFLSFAVHGFAAALVIWFGGGSLLTSLLAGLVFLTRLEYWSVLLQWPRQTAVSRVVLTHSGSWYLTGPAGFVHAARLIDSKRNGEKFSLLFMDNEWRRRCVVLTERNCSAYEKLRLAMRLEYLAALPGVNRSTPFWSHQ